MSIHANVRRAAFLSLFLVAALLSAVGPAGAVRLPPPTVGPAAPAPAHPVGAVASGPGISFWLLVGAVVVLATTVFALAAGWRYDRSHRVAAG